MIKRYKYKKANKCNLHYPKSNLQVKILRKNTIRIYLLLKIVRLVLLKIIRVCKLNDNKGSLCYE